MARIFIAIGFKPDLQIRLRHFKTDALKQLFSLGSKMYVFNLAELISVQANPIIITHFFGPASVSIYKPGQILTEHSNQFVTAFRGQLFPLTTGYHTAGNITKLQEILIKATRYSTLMAVAVSVMLVVFAEPIMKVWIGGTSIGQYYQTAAWILSLSAISSMLNSAGGSQWAVLLGMNRLKFLIWIASISGILNVLFSIYLVGYTSLGIIGVVVPTVILAAIRRPIIAVYTARACQLSPKRFLCETYIRPILVLLLLGIIALGARLRFQPDSVFAIAACLAITAAAWFPLCWFIGLEASDRKTLINLATRFREKKDSI
jgi:O-antigen/teichoic acid export membrane protein